MVRGIRRRLRLRRLRIRCARDPTCSDCSFYHLLGLVNQGSADVHGAVGVGLHLAGAGGRRLADAAADLPEVGVRALGLPVQKVVCFFCRSGATLRRRWFRARSLGDFRGVESLLRAVWTREALGRTGLPQMS